MTQKPEVAITVTLYSIAEQLKAIGNEGLQHYVNEWNKLQHETLVELGSKLYDILDTASITGSSTSGETEITSLDFSKKLGMIANDLVSITETGRKNYINPYVERHYDATQKLCTEIYGILEI
ncbi:MAG: hypothetical protein JSU79_04385, partial [Dehalococcoidales bacterium]